MNNKCSMKGEINMLKKKILAVFTILAIIISLIPVNVVKAAETLNAQMHLYMFPEGNQIQMQ